MIGKPEWFTYRAMGWGITPRTWQGWVYVGVFIVLFVFVKILPLPDDVKPWVIGGLLGLVVTDCIVIMSQLGAHHDERERLHQLLIERNCSFAAVATSVVALGFQAYQNHALTGGVSQFDPWILAVLGAMAMTKLASSAYVRRRL